jgi:hypothetical protein
MQSVCVFSLVHVHTSHGHWFALAHCSTSRWPPAAACEHVNLSHGHWFALAHFFNTEWPFSAAFLNVHSSHGHWFALHHFSNSRWPFLAALEHISLFHDMLSFLGYFSTSRCPCKAACAIVLLQFSIVCSSYQTPLPISVHLTFQLLPAAWNSTFNLRSLVATWNSVGPAGEYEEIKTKFC